MAITFVSEVSGDIIVGPSTTNVPLPAGLSEDDVLVSIIGCDGGISGDGIQGQGWQTIEAGSATNPGRQLKYKVMGATPDTTVDISENASKKQAYIIQAFRGVDTTTVQDTAFQVATSISANPDSPSITTVTDGALVISAFTLDDDETTVSVFPSGYTNTLESNTNGAAAGDSATVGMASKIVASFGAEDPGAYTLGSSDAWAAYSIALRPFVASEGVTRKIKISGTFQDKPIKTKVAGVFVDKPIQIKVGGNFQDA